MAINFKDARNKLADALRIQQTLTDVISTEERFITNTRASANKAKQSQVLEKLAQLDVENSAMPPKKPSALKPCANTATTTSPRSTTPQRSN